MPSQKVPELLRIALATSESEYADTEELIAKAQKKDAAFLAGEDLPAKDSKDEQGRIVSKASLVEKRVKDRRGGIPRNIHLLVSVKNQKASALKALREAVQVAERAASVAGRPECVAAAREAAK